MFCFEPLERGYGTTFGNAICKIMMKQFNGSAVIKIRFINADICGDVINGVEGNLREVLLNVKELVIRGEINGIQKSVFMVNKPCVITAGDFHLENGLSVFNPNHHIATVSESVFFGFELTITSGKGYIAEETVARLYQCDKSNEFCLDAKFTPIVRVYIVVENARVKNSLNFE